MPFEKINGAMTAMANGYRRLFLAFSAIITAGKGLTR
jgi:hypothetical protein